MSISSSNNSNEAVHFGKSVPIDTFRMLKVEISGDAREYILSRAGVVTVDLCTSFG